MSVILDTLRSRTSAPAGGSRGRTRLPALRSTPRRPASTGLRRPDRLHLAAVLALTVGGSALALSSLRGVDTTKVDNLGMISVLPTAWFAGAAVVAAAFLLSLTPGVHLRKTPLAPLLALVVLLHGLAGMVEEHPRFPVAWLHAGFVEQITRTHSLLQNFDARFSWPGAFTFGGLIQGVAGLDSAVPLIRYAPVVYNLLYLLPLWSIAATASRDPRVRWATLYVFVLANWVGQDYLSPQGLNLFLWLTAVAVVLRWFRYHQKRLGTGRQRRFGRLRIWLGMAGGPDPLGAGRGPLRGPAAAGAALLLAGLGAAMTVSHQLTPYVFMIGVAAMVVARMTNLRRLPLLLAVMGAAWLFTGARNFTDGHLHDIVGGIGNVGGSVDANVAKRLSGTDSQRLFVVTSRAVEAAVIWAIALVGLVRQWLRGRASWVLAFLAACPFPILGLQSYGGEVLLRVYLFTLPFMALILATVLLPAGTLRRPVATALPLGVLSIAALPAFVVCRLGNERFEQTYSADLHAVDYVYDHVPVASQLFAIETFEPTGYRQLERRPTVVVDPTFASFDELTAATAATDPPTDVVLLVTTGSLRYLAATGYGEAWARGLDAKLEASGHVTVLFAEGDARVYRFVPGTSASGRTTTAPSGGSHG